MDHARKSARGPAPCWGATPPPPRVRKYDRLNVVNSTVLKLIVVSNQLEELNTHFWERRTVACTEGKEPCRYDHQLTGKPRYGAWLAVAHPGLLKTCLLRLTAVAVGVEPRLRDRRIDLRGMYLEVWRVGSHEQTEMHARLLADVPRAERVPPVIDVRFAVERMLEAESRPEGAKNRNTGMMQRAFAAQQQAAPK